MPIEYPVSNLCGACSGTGFINGEKCIPCLGTGYVSTTGINIRLLSVYNGISGANSKLDSIIAEQASQRVDLTAALTAIWNKVNE